MQIVAMVIIFQCFKDIGENKIQQAFINVE